MAKPPRFPSASPPARLSGSLLTAWKTRAAGAWKRGASATAGSMCHCPLALALLCCGTIRWTSPDSGVTWVSRWSSAYVLQASETHRRVRLPSKERALAAANFQLGVRLALQERKDEAQGFFDEALRLWPEAWTFRRQAWNINPPEGIPANQRSEFAMKNSGVTFFPEDLEMVGAE